MDHPNLEFPGFEDHPKPAKDIFIVFSAGFFPDHPHFILGLVLGLGLNLGCLFRSLRSLLADLYLRPFLETYVRLIPFF